MRFFLAEPAPPQPVVQDGGGHGHQHPEQRKRQADLSQQIAGQVRIIPDAPAQPQVDNSRGVTMQAEPITPWSTRGISQGMPSFSRPISTKQTPPRINMVQWLRPRHSSSRMTYRQPPHTARAVPFAIAFTPSHLPAGGPNHSPPGWPPGPPGWLLPAWPPPGPAGSSPSCDPGVDGKGQGRQVFQRPGLALLAGGVPGQAVRGAGLGR